MDEEIKKYVQSCLVCQQQGKKRRNNPIYGIVETAPWQRVGINFIGPLKESSKGNKYIITAIDYFTHWVEARATPTASAEEAALFIYEDIICRHGAVEILHTDQGVHFINDIVKQLTEKFLIKHHKVTAYHPQANGLVERFNGILKETITKIMNEDDQWDRAIAPALFAYRTHHIESIGTSPDFLEFGRFLRVDGEKIKPETIWDRLKHMVEQVPLIHQNVIPRIKKAKQRDQQRYKIKPHEFHKGDKVMVHIENAKTFQPKWEGPFEIEEVYDKGTYALKLDHNEI